MKKVLLPFAIAFLSCMLNACAFHNTGEERILFPQDERKTAPAEKKSSPPGTESYDVEPTCSDVKYGPHELQAIDFWQADSDTPTPVVVFFHSGGYKGGDKRTGIAKYGVIHRCCLEAGISVVSANYRLRPETPLWELIKDGPRVIQFVRSKANEWNIDQKRVAACGSSAGSGMSLHLAYHDDYADPMSSDPVARQSSRVVAVGSWSGQASLDPQFWLDMLGPAPQVEGDRRRTEDGEGVGVDLWATDPPHTFSQEEMQRHYDEVGPITLLTPGDPPTFLFSAYPAGPPKNIGQYVHHPKHHAALAEKIRSLGMECHNRNGDYYADMGFHFHDASKRELVDFFIEHFGMPSENYLQSSARLSE